MLCLCLAEDARRRNRCRRRLVAILAAHGRVIQVGGEQTERLVSTVFVQVLFSLWRAECVIIL